ncbi:MAG: hypothetical protein H6607_01375 [Flavobacteriales bacterium]|nr:hypothetical protein [Flavobacteriales bacterium]
MNTNEQETFELIDQYLRGELIGQELDKFKIQLKDDPDFLYQVQVQKAIIKNIEKSRHAELKAMLGTQAKKKGLVIPFNRKSLTMAASFLAIIAIGLSIKIMLPTQESGIAKNETSTNQNINQSDREPDIVGNLNEQDSTNKEKAPAANTEKEILADAQTSEANADIVTNDNSASFNQESDDDLLQKLREDESKLDGDKASVNRDSITAYRNVAVYVLAEKAKIAATTADKEAANKQVETSEEKALDEKPSLLKNAAGTQKIEFWHSIVGFKGYLYNGQRLRLYDIVSDNLQLIQYNGQTYLKKGSSYYLLIADNTARPLTKITDTQLINTLNN